MNDKKGMIAFMAVVLIPVFMMFAYSIYRDEKHFAAERAAKVQVVKP